MKALYTTAYVLVSLALVGIAILFLLPTLPLSMPVDVKIVKSGSMEPGILTGSIVVIRAMESYGIDDIVTFETRGADIPTTHRIIATEKENGRTMFVTKGDANEDADTELIAQGDILGKVLFDLPYAGFVLDFARQPLGFVLLIGLPAFLIIIDEIDKIWKEIKKRRKNGSVESARRELVIAPFDPRSVRTRTIDMVRILPATGFKAIEIQIPAKQRTRKTSVAGDFVIASSIVLSASMFAVNIGTIGSTLSYFNDMEISAENIMAALSLGFTAVPDATAFTFNDGEVEDPDGALLTMIAPEDGSVPLKYDLDAEYVSGNLALCDSVVVDTNDPFSYSGPISALSATNVTFGDQWLLDIGLEDGAYLGGDVCVIDLVYLGFNAIHDVSDGTYEDEERVQLTFTAPVDELELLTTIFETVEETEEEHAKGGNGKGPGDHLPVENLPEQAIEALEENFGDIVEPPVDETEEVIVEKVVEEIETEDVVEEESEETEIEEETEEEITEETKKEEIKEKKKTEEVAEEV